MTLEHKKDLKIDPFKARELRVFLKTLGLRTEIFYNAIMQIRTGSDIVSLKKFGKTLRRSGPEFLQKIFFPQELEEDPSLETLAGIFAVKESTMKAFDLSSYDRLNLLVSKTKTGKPYLTFLEPPCTIQSSDISISHDGDYVMATAVFLIP